MTDSTSSAEPRELHHYSESAIRIDLDLLATSHTLAGILHQFEATCTEPGFRVHVSHVADGMGGHARSAEPVDRWVGTVGVDFFLADSRARIQQWIAEMVSQYPGTISALPNLTDRIFDSNLELLAIYGEFAAGRGLFYAKLLDIGRNLNGLAKNAKAGNVGLMDDLYRSLFSHAIQRGGSVDKFLKQIGSPIGTAALFLLGSAVNARIDWNNQTYGDDLTKTIGVNAGDGLMQFGISLNPYGAAVLAVNAAVQISGNLSIAVDKTMADFISVDNATRGTLLKDAQRRDNALDQMDLGNITKELSEAIYDSHASVFMGFGAAAQDIMNGAQAVARDPSLNNIMSVASSLATDKDIATSAFQLLVWPTAGLITPLITTKAGREGSLDVGKAVLNVVDGIADMTIATGISQVNQGIAIRSKLTNTLPISDELKKAINAECLEMMNQNSSLGDKITDFAGFDI